MQHKTRNPRTINYDNNNAKCDIKVKSNDILYYIKQCYGYKLSLIEVSAAQEARQPTQGSGKIAAKFELAPATEPQPTGHWKI